MKRVALIAALVSVLQPNVTSTQALMDTHPFQVRINQTRVPLPPVLSEGRIYLPLERALRLASPLLDPASSVTAPAGSGQVVVVLAEHGVRQTIDQSAGHVRFQEPQQGFDFRPLKRGGTTYIAAQDLADLLGGTSKWTASSRRLDLTFTPRPFTQVNLSGDLTARRRTMIWATPRYRSGVTARNVSGNRVYLFQAGRADSFVLVDRGNRYVLACTLIDRQSTCVWQAHLLEGAATGTAFQRYVGRTDRFQGRWDEWKGPVDAFEVSQSGAVLRVRSGTLDWQGQVQVQRTDSPNDPRALVFPLTGP